MDALDNVRYVNKSRRSRLFGTGVLWLLVIVTLIGLAAVAWTLYFQPPPATFLRAQILTPVVEPTGESVAGRTSGSVRMKAWVESPLDPICLISTQYYIEFYDGSLAKLPGMRITTQGEVKQSAYETSVPVGAPSGPARFYVRDTYNCGVQVRRVESPHAEFVVGGKGGGLDDQP